MTKYQYRSKFEEEIAKQLEVLKIPFDYEQQEFIYYLNRSGKCSTCGSTDVSVQHTYICDFRLYPETPDEYFLEVKGRFTPRDRSKMDAVIKQNPEADIRMVFQRDNWLTKKHKTRYSDWCKRKKITYYLAPLNSLLRKS